MLGYACIWAFVRPVGFEKSAASLIASMMLGPPSVVLVWMAARHLDKQWRFEAALSEDHKLITTGPYRWLRNPIYASMLGMLLATGFAKTWWPLLIAGVIFFVIGTEIRVRAEERLLAARFGEEFARYKATTPAYFPFHSMMRADRACLSAERLYGGRLFCADLAGGDFGDEEVFAACRTSRRGGGASRSGLRA